MRLAVVMPVWNKLYYTQKTVDSLFSATVDADFTLIVVDDGSTDETWQYVNHDLVSKYGTGRINYIQHPENRGVNAAWNTGLRGAFAMNAENIAIINNDLLFAPGWDVPLLYELETNPKMGVISPMSTFGAIPPDWPDGRGRNYNPAGYMGYMPILGACFAARRQTFWEIGLIPEQMKIYFGDNWIVLAAQNKGYECGYAQESYIHHLFCQTTAGLKNSSLWAQDGPAFEALAKEMQPFKPYLLRDGQRAEDLPVTGVR